jgi:hypothetical protein
MKVQDLIAGLLELDQEREIVFFSYIEEGRGGSFIEVENFDIEDHEDLEETYRLSISGNASEDGGYD